MQIVIGSGHNQAKILSLLDTGSRSSIITEDIATLLGISKNKADLSLMGANGNPITVKGKIENVPIIIDKHQFLENFIVAEISHKAILGSTFLEQYKFCINYADMLLTNDHVSIPLLMAKPKPCRGKLINISETLIEKNATLKCKVEGEGLQFPNTLIYKPVPTFNNGSEKIGYIYNITNQIIDIEIEKEGEELLKVAEGDFLGNVEEFDFRIAETLMNHPEKGNNHNLTERLNKIFTLCRIDKNDHLNDQEKQQVKDLITKYNNVFSVSPTDIGLTNVYCHDIILKDQRIVREPVRQIPEAAFGKLKTMIEQLLEAGVIEPSDSPYNSPVLMIKKPKRVTTGTGSASEQKIPEMTDDRKQETGGQTTPENRKQDQDQYRICIDFREINRITVDQSYPLPLLEEIKSQWSGANYFSSFDLISGYFQCSLSESSRKYTAFEIRNLGKYNFRRLPQGAKNSGFAMQALVDKVFSSLPLGTVSCYLDDLYSAAITFEEGLKKLELIFQRLSDANLKLSAKKSHILERGVMFCGVNMDARGLSVNEEKTHDIINMAPPSSKKAVQSLLGAVNFWRPFLPNLSEATKGLNEAIKTNPFKMDDNALQSVEKIKRLLISPAVLAWPIKDVPYILKCDASNFCIGAVLMQIQNGTERPIMYGSKCLSPSQINWSVFQKEFYSIYYFVLRFKYFLYGRPFTVYSDQRGLSFDKVLSKKTCCDTILRWSLELSSYTFEIKYLPGDQNSQADMMSRLPQRNDQYYDFFLKQIEDRNRRKANKPKKNYTSDKATMTNNLTSGSNAKADQLNVILTESDNTEYRVEEVTGIDVEDLKKKQLEDPDLKTVREWISKDIKVKKPNTLPLQLKLYHNKLSMLLINDQGLICKKNFFPRSLTVRHLICIPNRILNDTISNYHEQILKHGGAKKTYQELASKYYYPKLKEKVRTYVESCLICFKTNELGKKAPAPKMGGEAYHYPNVLISYDILQIDKSKNNGKVLTIVDSFTRFLRICPITNGNSTNVARALIKYWISVFGLPVMIRSDNATAFKHSEIMKELWKVLAVEPRFISPLNPRGNGQVERMNKLVLQMLEKLEQKAKSKWREYLPMVELAINTSQSSSTRYSPFELMFGRKPRNLDGIVFNMTPNSFYLNKSHYMSDLVKNMELIYRLAAENMGKRWQLNKLAYDKNATSIEIKKGDRVLVYRPVKTEDKFYKINKATGFSGPYVVRKNFSEHTYELENCKDKSIRIENRSLIRKIPNPVGEEQSLFYKEMATNTELVVQVPSNGGTSSHNSDINKEKHKDDNNEKCEDKEERDSSDSSNHSSGSESDHNKNDRRKEDRPTGSRNHNNNKKNSNGDDDDDDQDNFNRRWFYNKKKDDEEEDEDEEEEEEDEDGNARKDHKKNTRRYNLRPRYYQRQIKKIRVKHGRQ